MPLYEYKCSKCDAIFEVMRKFSDPPLEEHAGCGGKVERLLSAPAFQLKGTGWYATDYKKPSSEDTSKGTSEAKSSAKTESSTGTSSNPSSDTKSESKPEAKSAAETSAKNKQE